jgi:hypothetical protein
MIERKVVPGFSSYEAASDGNIYSYNKPGLQTNSRPVPKQMIPCANRGGYLQLVMVADDGKRKTVSAHKVIAMTFLGECPSGQVVCHNNGNKKDNRLENLRYDTSYANSMDRKQHGTHLVGSRIATSVLDEQTVLHIRDGLSFGVSISELARIFKVGRTTVKRIQTKETWAHV